MAKKKQQPIIETHGKVEKTQPTTLEQIWGFNELSKYGTKNESEYETQLKDMNRPELESHARRVGVVIVQDSARLRNILVKEFRSYNASLHKPAFTQNKIELSAEVKKILAEGR